MERKMEENLKISKCYKDCYEVKSFCQLSMFIPISWPRRVAFPCWEQAAVHVESMAMSFDRVKYGAVTFTPAHPFMHWRETWPLPWN
jgi:hypothetical protein